LNHGLGHSLQDVANCTHGVSCSILFPHIMRFNLPTCEKKLMRIAELMGQKTKGLSLHDAALQAIDAVKSLSVDVGIPQRLGEIGVTRDDFSKIVDILFTVNKRAVNKNPRECLRDDAIMILESAL